MATLKQKTAFNKVLENIDKKNPKTAGAILLDSGYDITTSKRPSQVLKSQGFQELLAQIDDRAILTRFYQILSAEDKRASIAAGIELLKLKDRYPAQRTKVQGLFADISNKVKEQEDTE